MRTPLEVFERVLLRHPFGERADYRREFLESMAGVAERIAAMEDTGFRPYGKGGQTYVALDDVLKIIDAPKENA